MNRRGTGGLHSDGGPLCLDNLLLQPEHVYRAPDQALQKEKQGGIREPVGS
jgi:hypothetical protein